MKLTESQLRRMVAEAVSDALNESYSTPLTVGMLRQTLADELCDDDDVLQVYDRGKYYNIEAARVTCEGRLLLFTKSDDARKRDRGRTNPAYEKLRGVLKSLSWNAFDDKDE